MKKVKLFEEYHRKSHVDMMVHDDWFNWRCKQAGIERGMNSVDDRWMEVLRAMPEHYDWCPWSGEEGMIKFTWDGGEELVPIGEFVDDLDEQPNLRWLWHLGYWDGPLDGVAELDGEMVYVDLKGPDDPDDDYEDGLDYRQYVAYSLTSEEKDELIRDHRQFQTQVGYHTDYGEAFKDFGHDEKPKWLPLWAWKKWRNFQFWRFYTLTSRMRKTRAKEVLKNLTDESKRIGVYHECQFSGKRNRNNV